jgi:hypothetical protein
LTNHADHLRDVERLVVDNRVDNRIDASEHVVEQLHCRRCNVRDFRFVLTT